MQDSKMQQKQEHEVNQKKCAVGWCMFLIKVATMVIQSDQSNQRVDITLKEMDLVTQDLLNCDDPRFCIPLRDYLRQMHEVEAKFDDGPHMLDVLIHRHNRLVTDPAIRNSLEHFPHIKNLLQQKSLGILKS